MPATDAMTLLRSLILSLRRVIVKRQLRVPAARPLEADWARGQPCPRPLLDAGGAQVGDRLYVIGGFESQAVVNRRLLVLDLRTGRWRTGPPLPPRVPESHAAICADDVRFLYVFAGQLGPNCRPAIPDGFSYDTVTGRWGRLPDLPAPRYAGTMQLLGNRLHFVGGAQSDRFTPAADHWSLAVQNGEAMELKWREETPVPLAAMHRGSAAVDGELFLFGGQQGDFVAIAGSGEWACRGDTHEDYFADCYRYQPRDGTWRQLRDMPIPVSHTDASVVVLDRIVHVFGGQVHKAKGTFALSLTDAVQSYNIAADNWQLTSYVPRRTKTLVCGRAGRVITCTTGQQDQGAHSDVPGAIVGETWCWTVPPSAGATVRPQPAAPFDAWRDRSVLLVTHELTWTGAPMLLCEAGAAMRDSGAQVRVVSLSATTASGNVAQHHRLPVIPAEAALPWAEQSELVLVNTAVAGPWIRDFLAACPHRRDALAWWIHENAPESYGCHAAVAPRVGRVAFDSRNQQAAWQAAGFHLGDREAVVLPGNRETLMRAGNEPLVPWPCAGRTDLVDRDEARRRLGVAPDEFLCLGVGSIAPHKGQQQLLRTIAELNTRHPAARFRLLLVGFLDDKHLQTARKSLSREERRVVGGGRLLVVQTPTLERFYRAADVFIMNSQDCGEPFGRVTIEAMAFGLPVVATRAGGTLEIVQDGKTGLLYPVGDAGQSELQSQLSAVQADRRLAARLGEAGRQRAAAEFTAARCFRELAAFLA